jgi:hypothetical protein
MVEVVKLKPDGENWSEWRESTQKIAEIQRAANYLVGTPPEPFREVFDSLARRTIECTIPKSISRHFRHYTTAREYIDYLTKRFDKSHQLEQAKTRSRVGEEGTKSRGKVGEGAGAASGPGMETTDQVADGVSLATPASSTLPQDDTVVLTEITPVESTTTPPVRTPHDKGSSGEGRGVAMSHEGAVGDEDDEECRALKRVDDETSRVETSEDETTTTIPETPHAPQSTPLKGECTGLTSGGDSESAACETDHPDDRDDAKSTNHSRPSEDPADATGDDERRPDAPTEPPDMPEGTRGRGSWERVEMGASREVEGGPADDGDEGRRPGRFDGPPDRPYDETRDPEGVQVEPGGETEARRNGSAAHEDADAVADGRAEEAHPDVQVEIESARAQGNT